MSVGRRAAAIAVSVISPGSGGLVLGRPMRAAGWLLAMALAYPLDLLWPMAGLLAVVVLAIASIFDAGLMRPSTKPPSPGKAGDRARLSLRRVAPPHSSWRRRWRATCSSRRHEAWS